MDELDAALLDIIQTDFPLQERPYLELADRLGTHETDIIQRLEKLKVRGVIRSIRAMYDLKKLGYTSTLVAVKAQPEHLENIVEQINRHPGVTHNYLRGHEYKVWFTVITRDPGEQETALQHIRSLPGVEDLRSLPAQKTFKLRVDFKVSP